MLIFFSGFNFPIIQIILIFVLTYDVYLIVETESASSDPTIKMYID